MLVATAGDLKCIARPAKARHATGPAIYFAGLLVTYFGRPTSGLATGRIDGAWR